MSILYLLLAPHLTAFHVAEDWGVGMVLCHL